MSAFLFVLRKVAAWAAAWLAGVIFWGIFVHKGPGWLIAVALLAMIIVPTALAIAHVHRVRLLTDRRDGAALANRHRPRIEVPFPAEQAFAMVEAAIRELPRLKSVDAAPGRLQIQARVRRVKPNAEKDDSEKAWNRVRATIVPGDRASSVTLVCEPEDGLAFDWFGVDYGSNLENAEAITRALAQRIARRRRDEEASALQAKTDKELTEAKLSLLNAQVEPHFLYNTLASAQLLTRADPAKADEMIGNLIAYLRRSLPRTEGELSTVGDEIERARAYLDIMRIRMGERLRLQIQVTEAVKAVPMPSMMLQTLVENAIKHGLEPLPGGGTLWITAHSADGKVALTVADDGRGFSEEGGGTGIGLRNVRERLRLAYGERAAFAIAGNFPKGVAATITLPLAPSPALREGETRTP